MTTAGLNDRPVLSLDNVIALLRDLARGGDLSRDLLIAPLNADTALDSLGLDSLGKMTLLSAIDEHYSIYIPDDSVTAETTIGSLVAQVARKLAR